MKYKDRKMIKRPVEGLGPKPEVKKEDRLNAYHGRLRGVVDDRDIGAFLLFVMTKSNVMNVLNNKDAPTLIDKDILAEAAKKFYIEQGRQIGEPEFRKEEPITEPIVK